jgi:outer membrane immunogenic protein
MLGGRDMKAFVMAAAGALMISAVQPTRAADMVLPVKAASFPFYNWSGVYLGGNFGGAWGVDSFGVANTTTLAGAPLPTSAFSGNRNLGGLLGGGQIGVNYMFTTHWVGGIELDIDGANITGSSSFCSTAGGANVSCANGTDKIIGFGTGRLRLGYAFDNVLFYGTGGGAWNQGTVSSSITCVSGACPGTSLPFAANSASNSGVSTGWAAGGGVEWGILPNWTVRAEYLRLQFNGLFNTFSFNGTVAGAPFSTFANTQSNVGVNVVRLGLNYAFNWPPQLPPSP